MDDEQDYPYIPNPYPVFSPVPETRLPTGGVIAQSLPSIGAPMNNGDENIDAPVWTPTGAVHADLPVNGKWNPKELGVHPQGLGPQSDL